MSLRGEKLARAVLVGQLVVLIVVYLTLALWLASAYFAGCGGVPDRYPPCCADTDGGMADSTPDAVTAPLLWSAANDVLAEALCDLGARCGTNGYAFHFGSGSAAREACIRTTTDDLCYGAWEGYAMCASLYPDKQRPNLEACPAASAAVDCNDGDLYWVQACNLAAPWSQ